MKPSPFTEFNEEARALRDALWAALEPLFVRILRWFAR